ncbi:NAD(+) diphosphatase [Aromatoleum buckelii]|uniref:NAD-capped RNA hydrolase NudC n=1 Tax=Aromatoleum buckelii TaxID=200254 RepID=A0ABX1N5C9_9RHOO|nr:NAD(+) diphosphatase [Aromatoleum buckelii]MCK0511701.1 NAD(+) diphosphatase [Aromatoleum buckelii]
MRMDTFVPGITEPSQTSDSDLWFVFNAGSLLVIGEGTTARVPCRRELEELGVAATRCRHYLGRLGERSCFTAAAEAPPQLPEHAQWQGLRRLFGRLDETVLTIAGRAIQVVEWDDTHRYCGRCGSPTALKHGERARVCPNCQLAGYPRLSPAVMGLVRRGPELLLARSPHFPEGMYSALAGFVEPGETLEQTLQREVREEVGVEITNLRYFDSQPWPFPHSLMIAFVADYVSGEIVPQPGEIEAAAWFGIDHLPRLPHPFSIARRLIDDTIASIAKAAP